jgi:hypothetical protein
MNLITPLEAERQVSEARATFGRFLSIWASQLLELERNGSRLPSLDPITTSHDSDQWPIAA